MITVFEKFQKLTGPGGIGSERFMGFIEALTRQVNLSTVLTGTGSPEGVVEESPTKLYMDTAGISGSILYIKQTGTGDTGWILV